MYRLYPDPGWFPNTVGLAYAAVKTWLYFPVAGHVLLVLCFLFFINLYGLCLFRVARNDKIALPVCYIQLSAPSITLYAITLWAQTFPGQDAVLQADPTRWANFQDLKKSIFEASPRNEMSFGSYWLSISSTSRPQLMLHSC